MRQVINLYFFFIGKGKDSEKLNNFLKATHLLKWQNSDLNQHLPRCHGLQTQNNDERGRTQQEAMWSRAGVPCSLFLDWSSFCLHSLPGLLGKALSSKIILLCTTHVFQTCASIWATEHIQVAGKKNIYLHNIKKNYHVHLFTSK